MTIRSAYVTFGLVPYVAFGPYTSDELMHNVHNFTLHHVYAMLHRFTVSARMVLTVCFALARAGIPPPGVLSRTLRVLC